MAHSNPFEPPRAQVEQAAPTHQKGKLQPYVKAGRVIRLMAMLGLVGFVGVGAAVLMPAMSVGQSAPVGLFLVLAVMLALVLGLFFVGSAVMRHESWARVLGIIYGVVSLIGFPIGTVVGGYVLWQLIFGWGESDA